MGEIAEAYIWGEMNGIDMNDNPDAWVVYYKELDEEEFRKRQSRKRRQESAKYWKPLLLAKGAKQIPNTPIMELGNWLCYYKNGYARDRYKHWVKIHLRDLVFDGE